MHFAAVQLTWACSLGKVCLNSCLASLHGVLACVFNTKQLLRRCSLILFNEQSPPQMLQYSTEQRLASVRLSQRASMNASGCLHHTYTRLKVIIALRQMIMGAEYKTDRFFLLQHNAGGAHYS